MNQHMLQVFSLDIHQAPKTYSKGDQLDPNGLWYDLLCPDADEIKLIEEMFQLEIPSQEDMKEIEASSRFYQENDRLYLTINVLAETESETPFLTPITFIFHNNHLITIRYADPKPFRVFKRKIERNFTTSLNAKQVFLEILEGIVDRIADILERIGSEIESISREIFKTKIPEKAFQREFNVILMHIGRNGDLSAKTRESLENIRRLVKFVYKEVSEEKDSKIAFRMQTLQEDVNSISDYLYFLLNKINFLLDATLGFINTEQNNVVKILSVAAVVFLPPTLIASIYGMNFTIIPELRWEFGYPLALVLMIISGILPYLYFKKKGWL